MKPLDTAAPSLRYSAPDKLLADATPLILGVGYVYSISVDQLGAGIVRAQTKSNSFPICSMNAFALVFALKQVWRADLHKNIQIDSLRKRNHHDL
jgi:hypothetical protein